MHHVVLGSNFVPEVIDLEASRRIQSLSRVIEADQIFKRGVFLVYSCSYSEQISFTTEYRAEPCLIDYVSEVILAVVLIEADCRVAQHSASEISDHPLIAIRSYNSDKVILLGSKEAVLYKLSSLLN